MSSPSLRRRSAAAPPFTLSRDVRTTFIPCFASWRQVSNPMPRLAPVTTATFFVPAMGVSSARKSDAALYQPERRFHGDVARSEEHTSELQSHSDLVCR